MKIVFLGTNGWYTSETGNTPCVLIDSKDQYVVFDAGNGIYKLDRYITEDKPVSLFISHFHLDHTNGLHVLPKFKFSRGLDIYVGEGRKKDFETLVSPPYTVGFRPNPENVANLKMEIRLHELEEGENRLPFFSVDSVEQFHAYRDHGYRVHLDGKIIAYSGDCGISEKSTVLAKDADVLIHECSLLTAESKDIWGHVDAKQAATLAKENNVKQLILTHFGADKFPTIEKRKEAAEKAKKIFPQTLIASDDFIFTM